MCERARGWASLALDGELSEFERALMAAHLERCAECAAFAAEVGAFTAELRGADLESLPRPVELPRRRRAAGRTIQIAAAAATLAVAVGLGGVLLSAPTPTAGNVTPASSGLIAANDVDSDALLRVPKLASLIPPPPRADRSLKFLDIPV